MSLKSISVKARLFMGFAVFLLCLGGVASVAWSQMSKGKIAADAVMREAVNVLALSLLTQVSAAALLLGLVFMWFAVRTVTRPLADAAAAVGALAEGKPDQANEFDGPAEAAPLMHALSGLQQSVRDRQGGETGQLAEGMLVKSALDNAHSGTMISDVNGTIVYINKAQIEMFKRGEADLRKAFSGFDPEKLLGKSIDLFHKNPAHQRHLISTITKPHRVTVQVGPLTYVIVATPVIDQQGNRLGVSAGWTDRTEELAAEAEVANIVKSANEGVFNKRLVVEGKQGFYKMLAEGMNSLLRTCDGGLNDVSRVLGAIAKGDLTEKITHDYQGAFGKLKSDCTQTMENLTSIVGQIREASDTIDTASREIAQGNLDLSQRTEEQASSLQETASSMEELTSTVKQNADNARQANQFAVGASDVAVKGGAVVRRVVETMSGISESSKKIADIIGTIDGIAFQTNILALNAAVEAARAGEQGRGFAVVAAEVRNLAQRSAEAAKEIKNLITDSVSRVEDGTQLVGEAGQTMDEIVNSIKRVTAIMGEITAASLEQTSGIEQVNQAITQMDEVTQQNAALVEEAASAAESLQEQSEQLVKTMATFRTDQLSMARQVRQAA